mgnify:CR=1 FL=1
MWDTAVGGHVALGEKIEDALKRETFEELGITKFKARFLGSYVWESSRERELVFPFLCTSHDAIHIKTMKWTRGVSGHAKRSNKMQMLTSSPRTFYTNTIAC